MFAIINYSKKNVKEAKLVVETTGEAEYNEERHDVEEEERVLYDREI